MRRPILAVLALSPAITSCGWALARSLDADEPGAASSGAGEASAVAPTGIDADEALALDGSSCLAKLDEWAVPHETVDDAPGSIENPIRLTGPVGGVTFAIPWRVTGSHDVLDCRLAVALAEWAAMLRDRGVVEVRLFSFYRRGERRGVSARASSRLSQHHFGLAIDAGWFVLDDGTVLAVDGDFDVAGAGETCEAAPAGDAAARLLGFFCDAWAARIFQVQLSPLHNRQHENHFHMDIGGGNGGWYVD